MGRIGEVLKCRQHHLLLASDLVDPSASSSTTYSKTAARERPRVQHLRIDNKEALYPFSPAAYRTRWDKVLQLLGTALAPWL